MGALAPVTHWIPEDDLLLKNAVEAGASLESLAKGAVQFSRKFTIRELQDRWHSLLYDPVISAEASFHMIDFERSAPSALSKSGRADHSKENKCHPGKRKAESIRRCYYAMRKRVCNEPLNPSDLSFLVPRVENCYGNGNEAPNGSNMLGDPMGNHFGIEDADFDDLHHDFPQVAQDSALPCHVGGTSHEFQSAHQNEVGEYPMARNGVQGDIPSVQGCNIAASDNGTGVRMMHPSKEQPRNNIEANSNEMDNMCSALSGSQVFSSPISDCEASFHHLHYSSPPPAMPDWRNIEVVSVPEMPGSASLRGNSLHTGDALGITDDADAENRISDFCGMPPDAVLKNSTATREGFLAELSNSLLNFTSEDENFFIEDKSYLDGLSSLLLNSPSDVNEDQMCDMPEPKASEAPEKFLDIPDTECPGELSNSRAAQLGDNVVTSNSEVHIPSCVSAVNPQFPELRDGIICCALNTEDPDVPCNNDIVFPSKPRPASLRKRNFNEANTPALPSKEILGNENAERSINMVKKEPQRLGESHTTEPETDPKCRVNLEMSQKETVDMSARHAGIAYAGPCQSTLVVKKEVSETMSSRQPGSTLADKSDQVSGTLKGHFQNGVCGCHQNGQVAIPTGNQELHTLGSTGTMVPEAAAESLVSDPEEHFSESDMDIPYFSDIESMILDMDLGPDDQDTYSRREVAKYQTEEARRAIIRLEQGAHSYMQRAIASHGALAILYGRHSKHYIKKPEVLLGRATDDVVVDIDLGREGRANKISRRQAIIKMDKDGSFHLKNLGKCSIYVNSKEVLPGQSLSLYSNCLIEIRGMPFIFEASPACVKRRLDNTAPKT